MLGVLPFGQERGGRNPPGRDDLAPVHHGRNGVPGEGREVAGVEAHGHLRRRDPSAELWQPIDRRRRRTDVGKAPGGHHAGIGELQARLLGQLTDRRRADRLGGIAEPLHCAFGIVVVDRPAGDRDIAGEKSARGAPLHDKYLGHPGGPVAHAHDRGGAANGSFVHGPILAGGGAILRLVSTAARTPKERILERIRTTGPIDFATFMDLALYGAGGFYDQPPVGAEGDFVTNPHVHPVFGALLGRGLAAMAVELGTDPVRLVEAGAGDGTLARQLLASELGERLASYTAVEVSPGARSALAAVGGITVADRLDAEADLVLTHELLDNLPFRLLRDGKEIRVDVDVDGDRFVERPSAIDEDLRAVAGDIPEDGELVVPVGALAFVDELHNVMPRGYALIVDYGGVGDPGGPMHGYREHHVVEHVLDAPGETDVTAGVDFSWIAREAASVGLVAHGPAMQRDVLLSLGFEEWTREELAAQQRHLADGDGLAAVRTWSTRSNASLLVDPAALGRLRWLVLATPGLPAPRWLGG